MNMLEWAEREIEIACKKERGTRPEEEWDYGCACYESALKAFKRLCEDGHSGLSISITKYVLNRLIDGKPLTPIEDTDDIWKETWIGKGEVMTYQCKRMSSLFKYVDKNGNVKYSDMNYAICVDKKSGSEYYSGLVRKNIIEKMFPITMPYMPDDKPIKIYCRDFLVDPKNGDFDTVGVYYAVKPDGERIEINRFFAAKDGGEFEEIDITEYYKRKQTKVSK